MKEKLNWHIQLFFEEEIAEMKKNPLHREIFFCYEKGLYTRVKTLSRNTNTVINLLNLTLAYTARKENERRIYIDMTEDCRHTKDYAVTVSVNDEEKVFPEDKKIDVFKANTLPYDTVDFILGITERIIESAYSRDVLYTEQRRIIKRFSGLLKEINGGKK